MIGVSGPFRVGVPDHWVVVVPGEAHGVAVLDPLPGVGPVQGSSSGGVRPNVVLRWFPEEAGGGVGTASRRELFADHALRAFTVVLGYEAGETVSGLPWRRHHVVADVSGIAVHSLRWYVGAGEAVLEVTLTFDETWLAAALWEVCDAMVVQVKAEDAGSSAAMREAPARADEHPASILHCGTEHQEAFEDVEQGFDDLARARPRWEALEDAGARVAAVVSGGTPVMQVVGVRGGRERVCEVFSDGADAVLVVSTRWGGPGAEQVERRVTRVGAGVAVVHLMMAMDVRSGWRRNVLATAPGTADLRTNDVAWDVRAGGEPALSVLHRPRDVWAASACGGLVAEWLQPQGRGLLAVGRDEETGQLVAGPLDGWTLYSTLLAAWSQACGACSQLR